MGVDRCVGPDDHAWHARQLPPEILRDPIARPRTLVLGCQENLNRAAVDRATPETAATASGAQDHPGGFGHELPDLRIY